MYTFSLVLDAWPLNPFCRNWSSLDLVTMFCLETTDRIMSEKNPRILLLVIVDCHLSSNLQGLLLKSCLSNDYKKLFLPNFFIPLQFKSTSGKRLFAPITQQQATNLGALFPAESSQMSIKMVDHLLYKMIQMNSFNKYVELCPFSVSHEHNQTIVSVAKSNSIKTNTIDIHHIWASPIWKQKRLWYWKFYHFTWLSTSVQMSLEQSASTVYWGGVLW